MNLILRFLALASLMNLSFSQKIFAMTYNVDAVFVPETTQDKVEDKTLGKVPVKVAFLRSTIFNEIHTAEKAGKVHDLIILHFQEVTSAAGLSNGIKNKFKLTEFQSIQGVHSAQPQTLTGSTAYLWDFVAGLNVMLTKEKYPFECSTIIQFEALGTVVCYRIDKKITYQTELVHKKNFGEYYDSTMLSGFGFKGFIIIKIVLTAKCIVLIKNLT